MMWRRFWLQGSAALFMALVFIPPALSRTLDLKDLVAPRSNAAASAPALPNASAALGETGKQDFLNALRSFMRGDFLTTERLSRSLTQSVPMAPEGWYLLGMALANLDRPQEAIKAMDQAAGLYKTNAEPLVIKGDLLLSLDRRDEAGAAWQAAIEVDPTNWRAQERMAALLESRGDREGAIRHYEQSISETDAAHLYPRLQAARLYLLTGQPARTEALLDDHALHDDASSLALDYLARAKVGLDKMDEGKALFDRLMARSESVRPFLARARLAVADQDLTQAEAVLSEARTRFPHDPALLLEQGRILGATGQYDRALAAFTEGLSAAPQNPELLRAASLAAARLGQDATALDYARTVAGLPGASSDDRIRLASLLERADGREEAINLYRSVLTADPQNWLALNNLANLLTESAPDEAVSLAERAVALAPGMPTLRDTLGWAQFKAGKLDLAARTFEIMRTENPAAALPAYRLGLVRLEQGMPAEARSLLQEAIALDPDFAYAADARQHLQ
jgi:tetratricopeptide (TPR) repeat protein